MAEPYPNYAEHRYYSDFTCGSFGYEKYQYISRDKPNSSDSQHRVCDGTGTNEVQREEGTL